MIQSKTIKGMLLLSTLVAGSFWASSYRQETETSPIEGLDTQLDYALRDFELRYYDELGYPSLDMVAPMLANEADTGIGRITLPVFDIVHRGSRWKIGAESAIVDAARDHLVLSGDVRMRREAGTQGALLEISTSELQLDISPRVASSDRPVRVIEGNDTMEAVGFRVNMDTDTFQLLNRVKLTYAVN